MHLYIVRHKLSSVSQRLAVTKEDSSQRRPVANFLKFAGHFKCHSGHFYFLY